MRHPTATTVFDSQGCSFDFVGVLVLTFLRWAFCVVFCALGLWRGAFGFGLFALAFGDGFLALGFWRWAFGVGLLALDFSRRDVRVWFFGVCLLVLVFLRWALVFGFGSFALDCSVGFLCWALGGRWAFCLALGVLGKRAEARGDID